MQFVYSFLEFNLIFEPETITAQPWSGRIQDFKLGGGGHLKKFHRAEEDGKIVGVFRVKNYDFTPKNHIYFSILGGARRVRPPPLDPSLRSIGTFICRLYSTVSSFCTYL